MDVYRKNRKRIVSSGVEHYGSELPGEFENLVIQDRDDNSTSSMECEDEEEDKEDKDGIEDEEKLFIKQIDEYYKNPYQQKSTENNDLEDKEIIGYDSPSEGHDSFGGYDSRYESDEDRY